MLSYSILYDTNSYYNNIASVAGSVAALSNSQVYMTGSKMDYIYAQVGAFLYLQDISYGTVTGV